VASYVTENLATPGGLATMPAPAVAPAQRPAIAPPGPRTRPDGAPAGRPAGLTGPKTRPDARPAGPRSRPDTPGTRPGGLTGPARPRTAPGKQTGTRGRQQKAMRIATAATASLVAVAVLGAAFEIKTFGFPFFVFRTAVGESGPGVPTDQQFLAQEAAAGVHRHDAAAPSTVQAATPKPTQHVAAPKGRHAAKSHKPH
jgi:hypothetical protein